MTYNIRKRYICPVTGYNFTADDDLMYLKFRDEYISVMDRNIVWLNYSEFKSIIDPRRFISYLEKDYDRITGSLQERLITVLEKDNKFYVYYKKWDKKPYENETAVFTKIGEYIDLEKWRDLLNDFKGGKPFEELKKYIK